MLNKLVRTLIGRYVIFLSSYKQDGRDGRTRVILNARTIPTGYDSKLVSNLLYYTETSIYEIECARFLHDG